MWLIVGLGNPGSRYEQTPHNLGFMAARCFAARHGIRLGADSKWKAEVGRGTVGGEEVAVMLPLTYMNLSGESVGPYSRYFKIHPAHVLAISDDVAIPWGKLRIRTAGSHGGHNGLRSLIDHLGGDTFPRLRIGCEPENWRGELKDYVLANLKGDALKLAEHMAEICADATEVIVKSGTAKAQNQFNGYDANARG